MVASNSYPIIANTSRLSLLSLLFLYTRPTAYIECKRCGKKIPQNEIDSHLQKSCVTLLPPVNIPESVD